MNQKSLDKKKAKELDWEKKWNKLTVKSYNLKTEKYEDEPIIFVNDKSWKKVKNFIQSLLTQQRTELLEEIPKRIKGKNKEFVEGYNNAIDDFTNLLNKKDE